MYIVKPDCQSQGRGIFLTRTADYIDPLEHLVAQEYVREPFLIDGLKFDLRIYVLVYGVNPLRIYVFDEGLARFATVKYELPKNSNLQCMFMHLTNYAINKFSDDFKQNENAEGKGRSHKRSLSQIYRILEARGFKTEELRSRIDDLIIKTLITAQLNLW